MSGFNPLVQGWDTQSAYPTSLFGALPASQAPRPTTVIRDALVFHITDFKSTILNSTVVNPQGQAQMRVITEPKPGRPTIWTDTSRRTVAFVDWGHQPAIEIPGLLPRTAVRDWLRTSADRKSRFMALRGVNYFWAPDGPSICLWMPQGNTSVLLARVGRSQSGAALEMTRQAMQYGLLEACVVASTLFLSGVPLD
ncbi:unnamed protein product [Peniophora sp. CBMAI 1063]|nr:unnamed protein product [Peniophora sp. CBMAI 1063]